MPFGLKHFFISAAISTQVTSASFMQVKLIAKDKVMQIEKAPINL